MIAPPLASGDACRCDHAFRHSLPLHGRMFMCLHAQGPSFISRRRGNGHRDLAITSAVAETPKPVGFNERPWFKEYMAAARLNNNQLSADGKPKALFR